MSEKIVLIDGNSIMNRAFYGLPDLTNAEGLHTNAVYGFLNIMFKILDEEKAQYLTVAFDLKAPTFRHKIYKEYKGTRKSMPEELREQMPIIKEVLKAMGITIIEKEGFEADDLLGTMAVKGEQEGLMVSLLSGDRDLLQLATEKIKIRIPKTKKGSTEIEDYHTQDVIDKYGITPNQIIDLKGLMGDASDNIPGIPGVGEKTAVKILTAFQSVEDAHEHIDEITPKKAKESLTEHYDMALLSKELATIKTDCPLEIQIKETKIGDLFNDQVYALFKKLEFKNLVSRFFADSVTEHKIEEKFRETDDLQEVEQIFAACREKGQENGIGLQFAVSEGHVLSAALCFGEEDIFMIHVGGFVTETYLLYQINQFLQGNYEISVLDLKSQLGFLEAEEESKVTDCTVAAYLLDPLKDSYLFDDIARDYLGMMLPSATDLLGKTSPSAAKQEKPESYLKVYAYMAYTAYKSSSVLLKELEKQGMDELYRTIELPLIYTLYDMQIRGIRANKEELKVYSDRLSKRIYELETIIYEQSGETFNINSPKQLGVILFEKLNLPFAKKTKTGYSTSADILDKLREKHPVINNILEYRQLTKLKSTYAEGLAVYIHPEDNRIHGTFNQTITATGRISSTEPNLQNIPIRMELGREIRKVFVPEDGCIFLDADYSQIELRLLAHMSGDEELIQAYAQEQDIHRITASKVFHIPLDEVTDLQRSNAKAVNFGIVYGISSFGLGQDLNITRKEAEEYIQNYFNTYPKIKAFLDGLVENGKKDGYVTTLFGRRRPMPELSSSNFMQRSFGERVAMNAPIQGTAADIIKIAMIDVNRELKRLHMKSRLILQIHDELLVETDQEEVEKVKEIMETKMREAADLAVPLEVEVKTGYNWFEAK